MADITRLSRFVGGLPRDVDMTTNSLQVLSLKVGTTAPAELTKAMVELLNTINTTGIPAANVSAEAKQAVLESKLAAMRVGVINFVPTTGNTSDVVTTDVLGGATTDTPICGAGGENNLSYLTTGYSDDYSEFNGSVLKVGENFTITETESVSLVKFKLRRKSLPTGNMRAAIYSDNSGSPDTSLYTSDDVNISAIPTSFSDITFTFTGVSLPAGSYWLVLETSTGFTANSTNKIGIEGRYEPSNFESFAAAYVGTAWNTPTQYYLLVYELQKSSTAVAVGISGATAKGIFVGTVSGAADVGKVLIRVNGTDNGFDDGNGDEIFGVLSESGGVYTLEYKKSDGTAYTISASDTSTKMDFYFIEVMDLYSFGVDRLLMPAIGGVVDATTASSIYSESTARLAADSSLQAQIDAEITNRTNADDYEYSARVDADATLQDNIDGELASRVAADNTLQSNINAEITARQLADSTLQANLDAEITARTLADSTLQSNIDGEANARSAADQTLQANIDAEATTRELADSTLQANIAAEATARDLADQTLQANIDAEVTARELADSTLQSQISGLDSADSTLQANIDAEITARMDADSTLQSNIDAEATARDLADSTLQANIDAEASARDLADQTLQANIDAETTARMSADSTLQANIDAETTARELADSTLQANINAEIAARELADSTLLSNINAEATARMDADSTLQANINAEATARDLADQTLQSNIDAEVTARDLADSTLQANIDAEATARDLADQTLQANIDAEVTARELADSTLQANIDAEASARELADSSLQAQIEAINVSVVDVSYTAPTGGIAAGDVVILSTTAAGEVEKANANGIGTCECVVGVALETITAGNPVLVRAFGEATVTTDGTNFEIGKRVYVAANATSGLGTKTPPATVNNVVYLVGGATDTNKVFVNTNLEYVVM